MEIVTLGTLQYLSSSYQGFESSRCFAQ